MTTAVPEAIAHLDHDLAAPCEIDRDAPDGTTGLFGCRGTNPAEFITWPTVCCPRNHAALLICQPCLAEILADPDGAACLWCNRVFRPSSAAFRLIEPLNRRTP